MSIPLEHDYIGLSEPSSLERSFDKISSSSSSSSFSPVSTENGKNINVLNLKETELRLGLPGFGQDSPSSLKNFVSGAKRGFSDSIDGPGKWALESSSIQQSCLLPSSKHAEEKKTCPANANANASAPAAKAQVVGWPPIRSFRKNTMASSNLSKNRDNSGPGGCLYVKVSMDGAPFLRKVDLKTYGNYTQLSSALEKMFSCFTLGQCTSHGIPGREGLSESCLKDILHGSECVLTYEDKDGDWMLVGDVPWEMFTDSCQRLRVMKGSEAIGLAPRAMEKCKNRN